MVIAVICMAVAVGIVIGAAIAVAMRRRRQRSELADTPRPALDPLAPDVSPGGNPLEIGPGYVVDLGDALIGNSIVRGTARFTHGPYTWWEHFLADGTATDSTDPAHHWLSVEPSEDNPGTNEVIYWTAVRNLGLAPTSTIEYEGVTYELDEHGRATYTTIGATDLPPSGTVEYWDYVGPGGRYLSFERYNGSRDYELSEGREVTDTELILFPPS